MEKYNWSLEKIYKNVDEARAEIKLCDEFIEKIVVLSQMTGTYLYMYNGNNFDLIPNLPFDISEQTLRKSLQEVELLGRFQAIKADKREKLADYLGVPVEILPTIIVDVGHNPHAARYLAERLQAVKKAKIFAIFSCLEDKELSGIVQPLREVIDEWHCVTLGGYRGQSGDELANKLKSHFPHIQATSDNSVMDGVSTALKSAVKNEYISYRTLLLYIKTAAYYQSGCLRYL